MKQPRNQLHKPRRRAQSLDVHHEPVKMYYKDGDSTMLFTKDLEYIEALRLEKAIEEFMKTRTCKIKGRFIYVGKK